MSVDYNQVARWLDVAAERFRAGIPPTDDDAKWFRRNRRSRNGWPRMYRVRPSVAADHWGFALGYAKPDGFITIVRRDEWWRAIMAINESEFGPVVDCDQYAGMRLQHMQEAQSHTDAERVRQWA